MNTPTGDERTPAPTEDEQQELDTAEVNAWQIVRPGQDKPLSLTELNEQNAAADEAVRKMDEEEARKRGVPVEKLFG